MGRTEKRWLKRRNRISDRKGKILVTHSDISQIKNDTLDKTAKYDTEALMTCFALATHKLYGHGKVRILRTLTEIDSLMGDILEGNVTIEEYKEKLKEETGVVIKCD